MRMKSNPLMKAQNLHLAANAVAAAWLRRRIDERAVFVAGGKRVIEIVVQPAARDDEVPRFSAVGASVTPRNPVSSSPMTLSSA